MKHLKILCLLFPIPIILCSCGTNNTNQVNSVEYGEISIDEINEDSDYIHIGKYADRDTGDVNLEISKLENDKFLIQIGIFRLANFEDVIGVLDNDIISFSSIDPSGNEISGNISFDDNNYTATVTFTNSTWEYIKNGDSFIYDKIK